MLDSRAKKILYGGTFMYHKTCLNCCGIAQIYRWIFVFKNEKKGWTMNAFHNFSELHHIIEQFHKLMWKMKFSSRCFYVTMQKKIDRLFLFVGIEDGAVYESGTLQYFVW